MITTGKCDALSMTATALAWKVASVALAIPPAAVFVWRRISTKAPSAAREISEMPWCCANLAADPATPGVQSDARSSPEYVPRSLTVPSTSSKSVCRRYSKRTGVLSGMASEG